MGGNIVGDRYSSVHRTLKFFIIELKQVTVTKQPHTFQSGLYELDESQVNF